MADVKDILIRYGVDPGNTSKAMNDIAKASAAAGGSLDNTGKSFQKNAQLGMNFNRVLQDSPYFFSSFNMGVMSVANNLPVLAESFQQARARGESFKTMMAGMFTGMGGWMTALNLAISGILAYTMYTRGAKEETEQFAGVFESMLSKMDTKQYEFDLVKAQNAVDKYTKKIQALQNPTAEVEKQREKEIASNIQLNSLQKELAILGKNISQTDKEEIERLQKKLDFFQGLVKESKLRLQYAKEYEELGFEAKTTGKTGGKVSGGTDITAIKSNLASENYSDMLNQIYDMQKAFEDIPIDAMTKADYDTARQTVEQELINGIEEDVANLGDEMPGLILPDVSIEEIKRRWREIHRFESNLANAAASTLRTGMNQAFDDIFGHANSLLEIFLQNLISGMATDLATQAGEGIFSWLTGGVSSLFGGIFGGSGGGRTADLIVTNIQIDGATVAQAVTPFVASQQYERSRVKR